MNAFVKKKRGSDNALENYFLELVVQKKVIDREIQNILDTIEQSTLHKSYKNILKKILFGNENLYLENWGTLQDGMLDAIKTGEVRADDLEDHGVVINMIVELVEKVFDIPDESMHAFILLEQRNDIEHALIALMKRMLDHLVLGLQELITQTMYLEVADPENDPGFIMLQKNVFKLPHLFFETEKNKVSALERNVFDVYQKYVVGRDTNGALSFDFSE